MKTNNNQHYYKDNLLLTAGAAAFGFSAGYILFKIKEKRYNEFIKSELNELEKENEIALRNINKSCLESTKKVPHYKNIINTFEKEGKIFGKDYHLKDILNNVDLKNYNKCLNNFYKITGEKKSELQSAAVKQISACRKVYLLTGTGIGIILSIGITFLKKYLSSKSTKDLSSKMTNCRK